SRFIFTNTTTGCKSDTSDILTVNAPTTLQANQEGELCPGETAQLIPQTGGTWSSSHPLVASVTANGSIAAIGSGVTLFSFTNHSGCVSPSTVSYTIHDIPAIVLNGDAQICVGTNTHFLPNTGGSWTSTHPGIATIDDQGTVQGIAEGNAQ